MQKTILKKNYPRVILPILLLVLLITSDFYPQSKIQSGVWSVSPSLADYSLDTNNGERSMIIEIRFKNPFRQKPNIFISVSQIDSDKETNVRYNVETISVSRDGFTLKVKTWADSKIFSLSGYWLAVVN
ncbi:MAG: H-type lectin domain-containing protein [Ignavibacteriaceae bacterium]